MKGETGASAPPASIASAAPDRISETASPIASVPAAQAVATVDDGPRSPRIRATAATGEFVSPNGTVNGLTRSAPRRKNSAYDR